MEIDDFKRKGPSVWSFMLMGIIGAIIGGALTLSFAPGTMYEGIFNDSQTESVAYTLADGKGNNENLTYAARSISRCLVWVAEVRDNGGIREILSSNTGFVVDSSGYILTSYYPSVGSSLCVYLQDNSSLQAQVVWSDEAMDVSVLKIFGPQLSAAALGDSDQQAVGQMCASLEAIWDGSRQIKASSGILCSKDRSISIGQGQLLQSLIQSEASSGCINPSGTPLVNSSGEVIGFNISNKSGFNERGFAIPINLLKPVIYSISMTGCFKEPDLGIEGIDSELASYYHIDRQSGILIKKLLPGGAAEAAGLKEGDIITAINGNAVDTLTELKQELYNIGVGNKAVLKVKLKDGTIDYIDTLLGEKIK